MEPLIARAGDAVEDNPAATSAADVRGFDEPIGPAARAQAEHLLHDLERDPAALAGGRTDEGGLYALDDAEGPSIRAQVEEVARLAEVIEQVRGCLMPGGRGPIPGLSPRVRGNL